jgi:hypothetical protein
MNTLERDEIIFVLIIVKTSFLLNRFIEYVDKPFEVVGQLAFEVHSLTRFRMRERQTLGVQDLTVK